MKESMLVVAVVAVALFQSRAMAANEKQCEASAADAKGTPGHHCKVECKDPHPACHESEKVIDTLKLLYEAYGRGDLKTIGEYLDERCTTFDEGTKKLIAGKEAVLEDVKQKIAKYGLGTDSPLVSYTIETPYAQVKGDHAVVTFVLIKEVSGDHPHKLESHCTDVFVKVDDKWKKIHFTSNWKPVT